MARRKRITDAWHLASPDKVHDAVMATVDEIRTLTSQRRQNERTYWSIYLNGMPTGLESVNSLECQFNLIAQGVDTAASQIVQAYRPQFTTVEADFQLQKSARKMTQVLEGQLEDLRADEEMLSLFASAAVTGNGELFGYLLEDGSLKIENCPPGSILVDPRDGTKGDPYCKYYRCAIARDRLLADYPNKAKYIEDASAPSTTDRLDLRLSTNSTVDDVLVIYAFRRPTNSKSKDGRFVVVTSKGALIDEDWDEPLPFVTYKWKPRAGSYYGVGIGESGMLSQARYRRYEDRVDRLESGPARWITSDKRNKVRIEKLTNEDYALVHYDGAEGAGEPQIHSYQVTPTDLVAQQDRVREQFLAELGISPMSAMGQKPAGLNSAVSQRTYREITQTRQKLQAEGFKRAYVDLFELLIRLNRRAASDLGDEYKVTAKTTRGRVPMVTEIDWVEVDLPANKYRISTQPISDLPDSAPGREELVSEWIASGMTSRNFAQNLMNQSTLDVDQAARLELCDMDRTMYDIERIEDGYQVAPDPYVKMSIAADIARRAYVQRSMQAVPEPILKALRGYVDACIALSETQAPAEPLPLPPQTEQAPQG